MVLNRNPENYFAETEQAAFSPSHIVPGIDVSPDRMLQGRLFSYPDTHRHRLGTNYAQIPINQPQSRVINHQRDGSMSVLGNGGSNPNYVSTKYIFWCVFSQHGDLINIFISFFRNLIRLVDHIKVTLLPLPLLLKKFLGLLVATPSHWKMLTLSKLVTCIV
jgi:hypothetical protein